MVKGETWTLDRRSHSIDTSVQMTAGDTTARHEIPDPHRHRGDSAMKKWISAVLAVSLSGIIAVAAAGKPPGAGGGGTGGGGSGTDGYVGQNLGALPGDTHSDAWDVNSQGNVVGRSYGSGMHAFYWNGTMHTLRQSLAADSEPPADVAWRVEAMAISGGTTEIAAGWEARDICTPAPTPADPGNETCQRFQYPIVWDGGSLGATPSAIRLGTARGMAAGINHTGTIIVGSGGLNAGAVWTAPAWARTEIPLAAFGSTGYFDWGLAWDVNDQGIAVGLVSRASDYVQFAYVYDTKSAVGQLLPMPGGYVQSDAFAVSNVVDGTVHIAGVIETCPDNSCRDSRGIRWTVEVSRIGQNGYEAGYEILDQLAWAEGASDQGFIAGTKNSTSSRGGNVIQTAMLWKPAGYIALKPPKGGTDSASRSMAVAKDGTIYVVGVTNAKGSWTAARWSIK